MRYSHKRRYVTWRADRITLTPHYIWPEDQEKMRGEEARTQRSQRSAHLHDKTHHSTHDLSCPDERDDQAGLDASQSGSGQIMLDANESGFEDDTDEVDSVVFEGPGNIPSGVDSYNDTEEVYTDAVEEPRNILSEVTSANNTDDAYTDILESLHDNTGEGDDDVASESKADCIFLPACGIIFLGAVVKREGSLLVTRMQEYFQEAKEDTCSSGKEEVPVDVQLQSSQKNENTLGDESRDKNTHVRFITCLEEEGTLLMNQQTMCSSLHSDSSCKRSRTEDLEIEA